MGLLRFSLIVYISFFIFLRALGLFGGFGRTKDHSRLVLPCKYAQNVPLGKLADDDWAIDCGAFFVAHLPVFVVAPLHYIPDIQQSDAVFFATLNLFHSHFDFLVVAFEDKIGEGFYLCDIPHVSDLADSQLSFEVTAACEYFKGRIESIPSEYD
jgi:hypothetical protein